MPDVQIETGGGVIRPESNKWGEEKAKYQSAIDKAGFAFGNVAIEKSSAQSANDQNKAAKSEDPVKDPNAKPGTEADTANGGANPPANADRVSTKLDEPSKDKSGEGKVEDPYSFHQGKRADAPSDSPSDKPVDPYTFHQGRGSDRPIDPSFAEKTPNQQYQDILQQAAQKGLPVVVVFGSQTAKDTEKQATQTLQQNMKEGEAMYLYVDTDKLDPNSDLGQVARRNAAAGQGLGETGKSDLAFTGIYTVEKKADGTLGLGRSTATFWGGRDEISGVMRDQLKYAKAATLNLGGETKPEVKPDSKPDTLPSNDPDRKQATNRPLPPLPENREKVEPPPPPPPPQEKDSQTKPENNSSNENKKSEELEKQEAKRKEEDLKREEDEKREKLKKQREQELRTAGGKDYTIDQYADGWGRFLERNEMQPGALRDALNEFGKEMITGEFDGQKLSGMMDKISTTDSKAVSDAIASANHELESSGIKLNVELAANGKVNALELAELAKDGVRVRATANGQIVSGVPSGQTLRAMALGEASMRLAKRAEAAACP